MDGNIFATKVVGYDSVMNFLRENQQSLAYEVLFKTCWKISSVLPHQSFLAKIYNYWELSNVVHCDPVSQDLDFKNLTDQDWNP